MNTRDVTYWRLCNLQISQSASTTPLDVVTSLGAMQAQDYPGALWAVGLRLSGARIETVEQAITDRAIIRTWPMRGTLHFVPANDVQWMLDLMTPRVVSGAASRRRNLELDDETFNRARELFAKKMQGGVVVPRSEMFALLEAIGISAAGQRGNHIVWQLAQEGLLCFGPHQGKQPTFVLLHEWVSEQNKPSREEAVATMVQRFFASHGPATEQDFARWSGLSLTDTRAGIAMNSRRLISDVIDGVTYWLSADVKPLPKPEASSGVYLLPGFDEYMLGYKDRSAALHPHHSQKIVPGNNGMFLATIISDGQVVGTWKKVVRKTGIVVQLVPFVTLSDAERTSAERAAAKYGAFLGQPGTLASS